MKRLATAALQSFLPATVLSLGLCNDAPSSFSRTRGRQGGTPQWAAKRFHRVLNKRLWSIHHHSARRQRLLPEELNDIP